LIATCAPVVLADEPSVELGDVINGWQVLNEKHCMRCHSVWGQGSQIGPDLGRAYGKRLTASELAGRMWNHVPRMMALMRQYQIPEMTLTRAEMADAFSFLYFVRYLDEPGDPREGRRVLRERKCAECHSLEAGGGEIGPDLSRWAGYVNPIVWAQMMWEHGAGMQEAMKQANIEWPKLDDDDLANIIAYVRSVGTSTKKLYLQPGSPSRGQQLFTDRGCASCHAAGAHAKTHAPDLARITLPDSLSALASRMWNHLPQMRAGMSAQGVQVKPLSAQEMADIISYLFALQYEGEPGDPARGERVFAQKRCAECHELSQILAATADAAHQPSAISLGHAIWQHGAAMADQMTKAGLPWPTFEGTEMADLIAYIRSSDKTTESAESVQPARSTGAQDEK